MRHWFGLLEVSVLQAIAICLCRDVKDAYRTLATPPTYSPIHARNLLRPFCPPLRTAPHRHLSLPFILG